MSYEPTNWKPGNVVTSSKLNKLEQGVAGASGAGVTIVDYDYENQTILKKAGELATAFKSGLVLVKDVDGDDEFYYMLVTYSKNTIGYSFTLNESGILTSYAASTAEDNPAQTT